MALLDSRSSLRASIRRLKAELADVSQGFDRHRLTPSDHRYVRLMAIEADLDRLLSDLNDADDRSTDFA